MCHTLVEKIVTGAVARSARMEKAKVGMCRTIIKMAITKAMAKSEARTARLETVKTRKCQSLVDMMIREAVKFSETHQSSAPSNPDTQIVCRKRKVVDRDTTDMKQSSKRRKYVDCRKIAE